MASPDGRALRPGAGNDATKSAAASPQVTPEEVEMSNVQDSGDANKLPLEDDIMQCARLGETGLIQKMFESGKYRPSYRDEEGISPLHWAAINNQYATCKYLIDQGADVNAQGGESGATPAMWAAQRCHYYVVHLLLKSGADPLLVDGQGYNILNLATIDGNAFLLVLLLHQEIPVDVVDPQQHTSLMWAAYKGFPACVDLLLRWGANVNARDEKGLTPLHWALVKGSQPCIQKIIEFGGDRFAETNDGKSPTAVAEEMRSTRQWHRALAECGYDSFGRHKVLPMGVTSLVKNENLMSKFYFLYPFLTLWLLITIVSSNYIYIGLPIAVAVAYASQFLLQKIAMLGPGKFRNLHHTPYLAGWFAASSFFVGTRWVWWILPVTFSSNPIFNILFAAFYGLTNFFYSLALVEDPGYIARYNSRNKERETIEELFSSWKFDEENFCIQCMVRKPLRSKHCRRCGKCVAKHDHHCPWINNCVAANNHRHFMLYTIGLEITIILFVRLVLAHIEHIPEPSEVQCTFLSKQLCAIYERDTWTWGIAFWSILQLTWVTMLIVVQTVQISRNQTTLENMRSRHGDTTPRNNASQAITAALTTGTTSLAAGGLTSSGMGPNPAVSRNPPPQKQGFCGQWTKLLGLDTFIAVARGGLVKDPVTGKLTPRTRTRNPFSRGVITNCKDFWLDPAPYFGKRTGGDAMLGGQVVNYARMYDTPLRTRGGGGMVYTSLAGQVDEEGDV